MIDLNNMKLNLTLAMQAIHFYVAYLLVKKLLFQPVFRIIRDEKEMQEVVEQSIEHSRVQIEHKYAEKDLQWRACTEFFQRKNPTYMRQVRGLSHIPDSDLKIPDISAHKVAEYVHALKEQIIKRVQI